MTLTQSPDSYLDQNEQLKRAIASHFEVVSWEVPQNEAEGALILRGYLKMNDSDQAYDEIAQVWHGQGYTAYMRWQDPRQKDLIELVAQTGVLKPKPSNSRINLLFFILTLISMILVGGLK